MYIERERDVYVLFLSTLKQKSAMARLLSCISALKYYSAIACKLS